MLPFGKQGIHCSTVLTLNSSLQALPTLLTGPPEYTGSNDDRGNAKNGKYRKMESALPAVPVSFLGVEACDTVSHQWVLGPGRVSCGGRSPFTELLNFVY